jgi:translation elongation factor EF-G
MEGQIQLLANYENWKAIKKITITDKTDPLVIAEFLASLTYSVDGKIEDNLRKIIELEKVDKAIAELGFDKTDVGKAILEVNSRNISKVINEICKLDKFSGPAQKELIQMCKIYATKKAIIACKLPVEYYEADIPTLKRAKKASTKKK